MSLVTVVLTVDMSSPAFKLIHDRLLVALREAFDDTEIEIRSKMRSNSTKLQVSMSLNAMVCLYNFALRAPSFLAGLGIIRFNALGRSISVVVQPPGGYINANAGDGGTIPITCKSVCSCFGHDCLYLSSLD